MLLSFCLNFCLNFQLGVGYKGVANKKGCIVKNANVFHEKVNIFFQYFDRNIIIMNRFPLAEVFDFPSNIDLFKSTERKGASFICILYCLGVFCISLLILIQDKAFPQTACWCYLILEFETKIQLLKSNR